LALAEMLRLLAPGGFIPVVDWERGRKRTSGPLDGLLYAAEAADEIRAAGLTPELLVPACHSTSPIRASKSDTQEENKCCLAARKP
jgi:hypothetical protein